LAVAASAQITEKKPAAGLVAWLGSVLPGVQLQASEPAVTRAEVALWLAEAVATQVLLSLRTLGRPGLLVVRCRFQGFGDDLQRGLKDFLSDQRPCEVLSSWPTDTDEARIAARETVDALNAGLTRIFVLPHERVLTGFVHSVDAVFCLPRFDALSLGEACRRFYELPAAPVVPVEPWVGLVCPSDLLISSEAAGNPVPAIRDAVKRRLSEHDCSEATPLDSLLGLNEVRAWAQDLIEDIRDALDPQIQLNWSEIERAVVFAGPRGVGRTSLSKAIARATNLQWVRVSAANWVIDTEPSRGAYRGDRIASLSPLEEDFHAAKDLAPALMFIDDLENLSADAARTLCRLINENDGTSPVLVVGSTGDDEVPDPDLLKAAGFEHTVYLPLPTSKVLSAALGQHLHGTVHELNEPQILQAGRLALGETISAMALHVRRAQKTARRADNRPMRFDDLAAAILETPSAATRPKISARELEATAYHEAGHAVMKFLEAEGGKDIQYVSIVPRRMSGGTALGFVMSASDDEQFSMSRAEILAWIRTLLGGRAAEELLLGAEHVTTGAGGSSSSDLAKATRTAGIMIGRCGLGERGALLYRPNRPHEDPVLAKQTDALLRAEYGKTVSLLKENWSLVVALGARLLADQEMSGDDVRATLRGVHAEAPAPQP